MCKKRKEKSYPKTEKKKKTHNKFREQQWQICFVISSYWRVTVTIYFYKWIKFKSILLYREISKDEREREK